MSDENTVIDLYELMKGWKELEAKEKEKKARTPRTPRNRSGRPTGTDTQLTEGLVYEILVPDQKAIYICEGLGTAERMAQQLKVDGHHPVVFNMSEAGNPTAGKPFRLVLRKGSRTKFRWFPSEKYDKFHLVRGDKGATSLIRRSDLPSGGVLIEVTQDEDKKPEEAVDHINMYNWFTADIREYERLAEAESTGRSTITEVKDIDLLVLAFEIFLDTRMSEDVKRKVMSALRDKASGKVKTVDTGERKTPVTDELAYYRSQLVYYRQMRLEYDEGCEPGEDMRPSSW